MTQKQALPALTPETYINRELATVEFNRRIMAMAEDPTIPLLERVKYLAIVGNNLDEFYMVRVASAVQKAQVGITRTRPDGYTPQKLLMELHEQVSELLHKHREIKRHIFAELEREGIYMVKAAALPPQQRAAVRAYFEEQVYPVLTPLAVDHARPFPFISNLSLNLGVYLMREEEAQNHHNGHHHLTDDLEFVRIKVPQVLPRLVFLRDVIRQYGDRTEHIEGEVILWMEDIIADNLDLLFPGMQVVEHYPFRVLRNADIDYDTIVEEEMLDIKSIIEQGVRERKFGSVVRLSVPTDMSRRMLDQLIRELEVDEERDVYYIEGELGSANLFEMMRIDRPDLKYPHHTPRIPPQFNDVPDIFSAIRQQEILLHHPYDSFQPVIDFFYRAAQDPDVLAIKATLYRLGSNPPVIDALLKARENEKQVTVLVELKARFDEENNLEWTTALEEKGVHVIYGVEELPVKTHAKIAMVVRREAGGVRRYIHVGTGNYNAGTAKMYTDIGLLTTDPIIGADATRLFNRLTGFAPATHYERLLVAPEYLHSRLVELIDNEIEAARQGHKARLIFKMNQLEEDIIIQKLYEASQAGVQIDLIVRGFCCLRPGVPNLSENIRVISIIGRFLEHSRIYYFQNAPYDQQFYLGSADLMRRNLYNRVEVVFPLLNPHLREKLLRLLATQLRDNVGAWEMQPDGSYIRRQPSEGEEIIDSQAIFTQNSFGLNLRP
ncbi:MAG: polyphosphate kinase 1 [Chloroflexi bacterium]|nr:MAG: polyphosphate kinase 1 [Chloroflexota bacterium]